MLWTSEHTKWLVDTDQQLKTADGKDVEVWEFRHENDVAVLFGRGETLPESLLPGC